jgi:hypothetical protein
MKEMDETKLTTLVETDDSFFYTAEEPDGEVTYHLQINNVTIHFFMEEWQSALEFLKKVVEVQGILK